MPEEEIRRCLGEDASAGCSGGSRTPTASSQDRISLSPVSTEIKEPVSVPVEQRRLCLPSLTPPLPRPVPAQLRVPGGPGSLQRPGGRGRRGGSYT